MHPLRSFPTLFLAAGMALAATGPVIHITSGEVRGRETGTAGGAVFQGIPFAQPPIGDLRWREPQPVRPWSGIRDATRYGAPCAQIAAGWNDHAAALGSEDCLSLNVWTSEWSAQTKQPVMVWIHGGANMGGSALGSGGIEPPFDGERLARLGVVVVTVQYRLGVLGFIGHPELTAESPHHASGNYGLLDLIAALHWVHDNIAQFGGDPGSVTIFGQSAGAQNVGLLMASPLARGLFQRAIEESGSVLIGGRATASSAQADHAGQVLAKKLNAPADGAIAYLRSLPVAEILKASPPYGGGGDGRPVPSIDGYAIRQDPSALFRSGKQAPVPLMIGNNTREFDFNGNAQALRKAVETFYGPLAPQALKLYGLADKPAAESYPAYGGPGSQFSTDNAFRCPAVLIAGEHAAHFPTYEYQFGVGPDATGVPHSGELPFVFGTRGVKASADPDASRTAEVQQYWTNFAKTGDPNGADLPDWPKYEEARHGYLEFTMDGPVAKTDLRKAVCGLFVERLNSRSSQPSSR
jgi:para-nitrobenzyl esterase